MATIDLSQLTVFVNVVRSGSFTAAANVLGTQKAHASRVVSRLEKSLGARLLQRSTRSLAVTEVGRELYERAVVILAALEDTEAAIQRTHGEPRGALRIACGTEFGLLVVNGWICEFLRQHPKVRVDAEVSNRLVDLIHEGFDLAIRVGALADSSLSARRLGEIRYALYASKDYLRRHHAPAHPRDLAAHDLVMFAAGRPAAWRLFKDGDRFDVSGIPRFILDNNIMAHDATVAGLGVALLPGLLAAPSVRSGRLVEILHGWTRTPAPIHAIFASRCYLAPKVRAFIDLARSKPPNI
jgi:DNA-binding transcriptional LysR family regulator